MTTVAPLHRTLDQELAALLRGASLECLACGEFVMHARGGVVFCPECSSQLGTEAALAGMDSPDDADSGLGAGPGLGVGEPKQAERVGRRATRERTRGAGASP